MLITVFLGGQLCYFSRTRLTSKLCATPLFVCLFVCLFLSRYPKNSQELVSLFDEIHLVDAEELPAAIILDHFEKFFSTMQVPIIPIFLFFVVLDHALLAKFFQMLYVTGV